MYDLKITPEQERKFLICLFSRYTAKHGYGKRNLKNQRFSVVDHSFEVDIPEIVTTRKHSSGMSIKEIPVTDLAQELEIKGFAEFFPNRLEFHLTESGYDKAEEILAPAPPKESWLKLHKSHILVGLLIAFITVFFFEPFRDFFQEKLLLKMSKPTKLQPQSKDLKQP
jgi:hypothetical protein